MPLSIPFFHLLPSADVSPPSPDDLKDNKPRVTGGTGGQIDVGGGESSALSSLSTMRVAASARASRDGPLFFHR